MKNICLKCGNPKQICSCEAHVEALRKQELQKTKTNQTVTENLNFLHEQVIYDSFFMSRSGFISWYKDHYQLCELESSIIWDGIMNNIDIIPNHIKVSYKLSEEERQFLYSELKARHSLTIESNQALQAEDILETNKSKTKKEKIILLHEAGIRKEHIQRYLSIDNSYLEEVYRNYINIENE